MNNDGDVLAGMDFYVKGIHECTLSGSTQSALKTREKGEELTGGAAAITVFSRFGAARIGQPPGKLFLMR
jgi:hypothetical protein